MRCLRCLSAICLALCLSVPLWAQDDFELSYLVIRSTTQEVLAAQEEAKLRVPASTMKLLTAAAALERLGPAHRYRTTVGSAAPLRKGRLHGDLYLKGDADPELTRQALSDLAEQLHARGVRRVTGDLVVDEGPYASPPYGSGWAWDDAGATYSPEVTGLAVEGGVVRLSLDPSPSWLQLQEGSERSIELVPGRAGVVITGAPPERLAPPDSALRSGELFCELLEKRGIAVSGKVRRGTAAGKELAAHGSRPLQEILHKALSDSDNLAMELIGRSTGAALPQVLDEAKLRQADGSGLSRYNLLSTEQLCAVLLASPDLKNLLPGPGEGTLRTRFSERSLAGQLRAKTGTLGNISGLAGYLYPNQPQECVFAILINGHLGSASERKAIEDSLVKEWLQSLQRPTERPVLTP